MTSLDSPRLIGIHWKWIRCWTWFIIVWLNSQWNGIEYDLQQNMWMWWNDLCPDLHIRSEDLLLPMSCRLLQSQPFRQSSWRDTGILMWNHQFKLVINKLNESSSFCGILFQLVLKLWVPRSRHHSHYRLLPVGVQQFHHVCVHLLFLCADSLNKWSGLHVTHATLCPYQRQGHGHGPHPVCHWTVR